MVENIVMKIGGSCLVEKKDMVRTISILRDAKKKKKRPIVVLSALKGVTDMLIAQANNALRKKHDVTEIRSYHYKVLGNLQDQSSARLQIDALLEEMENILKGISYLGELSPATSDRLLSFGERLSCVILEAYLNETELRAKAFVEPLLITDDCFCDATILPESERIVKEKAAQTDDILIFPGFIGKTTDGRITTLGRGGSDYTATFIAAALGCPCILWKDVDGMMNADPKIVPGARVVKNVNYYDAMELSHYGSKVIYSKAIKPALKKNVPIFIKNFDNDKSEGTEISSRDTTDMIVSAVKSAEIFNIPTYIELNELSAILSELAEKNLTPLLFVESSSLGEFSMVVSESMSSAVDRIFKMHASEYEVKKNVGIVSIVCDAMRGHPGMAAKIFDELAAHNINVIAISQPASERIIAIVVSKDDVVKAVQVLHAKLST